ncbi:MAG TPA: cation diffusion facilitator family transporter [Ignavibacteriaceae bacterium]|nr:cation diffusion facilitator family transporter [Ignavibacteriaceae bacterium]
MQEEIKLRKKAAYISLSVGVGMFIAKSGAYFITGSEAIFSDAAESVVHVIATSIALYSIILSSKPPDESHPYGHGKVEFFSAGIEGFLIVFAALYIIFESVKAILIPSVLKSLDLGVIVIAAAGIINFILGYYLIRMGKKTNSLTLVADGKHVLTDSFTSIGVLVGIILVMITNYTMLDPIFAIGVALNILFTGFKLMRESVGGLMNEMDIKMLEEISDELIRIKKVYWIDIHELRFWISGDKIFLDFHLIMPYYFSIRESHTEENEIEELLLKKFPRLQLKIHFDYCLPALCKFCMYEQCDKREMKQTETLEWNKSKLIGRPIYLIKS